MGRVANARNRDGLFCTAAAATSFAARLKRTASSDGSGWVPGGVSARIDRSMP
jgi:hypothetical protein